MTQEAHEFSIRRILVALDNSAASLRALAQAVELAADFGAELQGLYVEDISLVRLAELSITQEVGVFSARRRQLELQYVERQFRGQAHRVQQTLAMLAERAGVNWRFQVVRGEVVKELLLAASDADMIILGRVGLSKLGHRRLGSTARAILLQATQLTLLLRSGIRSGLPFMTLYDGSGVTQKTLVAASRFMQGKNGRLAIFILADGPEVAQKLQQEATTALRERNLAARYIWQRKASVHRIIQAIQMEGCGLFVLPSGGAWLKPDLIFTLLDKIDCPVLLVR